MKTTTKASKAIPKNAKKADQAKINNQLAKSEAKVKAKAASEERRAEIKAEAKAAKKKIVKKPKLSKVVVKPVVKKLTKIQTNAKAFFGRSYAKHIELLTAIKKSKMITSPNTDELFNFLRTATLDSVCIYAVTSNGQNVADNCSLLLKAKGLEAQLNALKAVKVRNTVMWKTEKLNKSSK